MANKNKKNFAALIGFLLTLVLVIGLVFNALEWWTDIGPSTWGNKQEEQTEPKGDEEAGVIMPDEVQGEGIKLMSKAIPVAQYGEYGISPLAASAYQLTATITPENATNKAVDWKIEFVNPSSTWANGKQVASYGKITPTADGALTANFEVVAAFGEQLKITVTSRQNTDKHAECVVDYAKRITGGASKSVMSTSITWGNLFLASSKIDPSVLASLTHTPTLGVGTVEDNFTYTATVTYKEEFINALKANGFTPAQTAGKAVSVTGLKEYHSINLSAAPGSGSIPGLGALSASDHDAILADCVSGSNGIYNRYVKALTACNAVGGIFTYDLTATGTYSTYTVSTTIAVNASTLAILVEGVGLNHTTMTV